ncbi:MAG: hypothetical protein R3A79_16835 [Nannocystaceae bacterium]
MPSLRRLILVAPFALSLALFGCPKPDSDTSASETSSDSDTGEPVVPLAAIEEACAGLFDCACALYPYDDAAACVAAEQGRVAALEAAAATRGLTVDAACVVADLAYNRLGCDPWPDGELGERGVGECPHCQPAYGSKAVGEACVAYDDGASDCAQGLRCAGNVFISSDTFCYDPCAPAAVDAPCPAAGCGDAMVCTRAGACAPKVGREGDECGDPAVECGPGLACDESADEDAVCFPGFAPGEPCGDCWYCCAGDSYCGASSTCEPLPLAGEACGPADECADGLYCADGSADCTPLPGPGEPCEYDCAEGSYCATTTSYLCVPYPTAGEPCSDGLCAGYLECSDGVCVARPAICAM